MSPISLRGSGDFVFSGGGGSRGFVGVTEGCGSRIFFEESCAGWKRRPERASRACGVEDGDQLRKDRASGVRSRGPAPWRLRPSRWHPSAARWRIAPARWRLRVGTLATEAGTMASDERHDGESLRHDGIRGSAPWRLRSAPMASVGRHPLGTEVGTIASAGVTMASAGRHGGNPPARSSGPQPGSDVTESRGPRRARTTAPNLRGARGLERIGSVSAEPTDVFFVHDAGASAAQSGGTEPREEGVYLGLVDFPCRSGLGQQVWVLSNARRYRLIASGSIFP